MRSRVFARKTRILDRAVARSTPVDASPVIESISPEHGTDKGGTTVVVRGRRLGEVSIVRMSAVDRVSLPAGTDVPFTIVSDSRIELKTPSGDAGAGFIYVYSRHGVSRAEYTYDPSVVLTLTSLRDLVIDTAGGGRVQIATGTGFLASSVIVVGGVDVATTYVSATEVQCTMPAHAAGSVDVKVRNGAAVSGAIGVEYTTASTVLSATGVWGAPYAGAPLSAQGGSVGGSLGSVGDPTPAVGAELNGLATIDTTPASHGRLLSLDAYAEDYVSVKGRSPGPGYTITCLFLARSLGADNSADPYANAGLVAMTTGGYFLLCLSDAGLRVACFDGAYKQVSADDSLVPELDMWVLAQVVHTGTALKCRLNGGPWQSVGAGLPDTFNASTYRLVVGANYDQTKSPDALIAEAATSKAIVSDENLDMYRALLAQRFDVDV